VQAACDRARSKTTAFDANSSMNGVVSRWYPYVLIWSARRVSTRRMITFFGWAFISGGSALGAQSVTATMAARTEAACI